MRRRSEERWRHTALLAAALSAGGCVAISPYQVHRISADYNTERKCSVQTEVFEHLPLPAWRVLLMQWGYNVGAEAIPAGLYLATSEAVPKPTMTPAAAPASPGLNPDLLDQARPPDPVVKPGTTEAAPSTLAPAIPPGPTAWRETAIRQAGYQSANTGSTTATWLFAR